MLADRVGLVADVRFKPEHDMATAWLTQSPDGL